MKTLRGKRIYFFGIGGVSMSALAIMLKNWGFEVAGSDERGGRGTQILQKEGIDVDFQLNEDEIRVADVIVASSAIKADDPHMLFAKRYAKEVWTRGELLGWVSSHFEKVIAVAGSHGKTTTTAMIYEILWLAGKNPTLHLGGFRVQDGLNYHFGGEEFFVTEACEYHNNFLSLHPHISVVTNVEKEHMDFFKTFSNQLSAFEQFKRQSEIVVEDCGSLCAKNIQHDQKGGLMFSLCDKDVKIMDLHLRICEEVNTQNCIFAYLAAKRLKISDCIIKQALENFAGVAVRFESKSCPHFNTVICDYAHHPTELAKAISTAKKIFKEKQLVTIFQPHTFSRTKTLLPQFVSVFENLPCPVFFKTYSAREQPCEGLSGSQLCQIVEKTNQNARYFDDFEGLFQFLQGFSKEETALLFLGAGDLPDILHKNSFIE